MNITSASDHAKNTAESTLSWKAGARVVAFLAAILVSRFHYYYAEALLVLAPELLSQLLDLRANAQFFLHRRLRNYSMLQDSLGAKLSGPRALEIIDNLKVSRDSLKELEATTDNVVYYTSAAPRGERRLIENVCESSFYSSRIARLASLRLSIWPLVLLALSIAIIVFLPYIGANAGVAQTLIAIVTLVTLFDKFREWKQFHDGSIQLRKLSDQCLTALTHPFEPYQAFELFGDYAVLSASIPPIPEKVFKANEQRIGDEWKRYLGATENSGSHPSKPTRP